ncbi:MAG TPA: MAPEG family protein [Oscillatoriaceae cyanobacterium M33_DOE_052]|uniref:MAPEG family protein n=1 Tax=Planktothricoides sp. SpSt-374 TaxID=2282167 RepID=A0A7C3VKI3_9CYAN|nr:MAPEG family protein [Oscillatoriaceae cyanobacterium M33_DOE_052]
MSPLPSLVTIAALLLYFVLILNVGRARYKYQIMPPQVSGNPDFERVLRVQENTLEHIIIFLPALWLFSYFVSPLWASVLGAAWIVGRALYAIGYYQAPEKRFPGFGLSMLATLTLLLGGLVGVILPMVKTWF